MKSIVLSVGVRTTAPLLMMLALFAFLRGHNEPGGGFIAGLLMSCALALVVLSDGLPVAKRLLRIPPIELLGAGLTVSLVSGMVSVLQRSGVFKGNWFEVPTPFGPAKWGTPLFFDLGVMMVVVGAVMAMVFSLAEELPS